nr:DUF2187 family protein [Lysinibacillus timonensis]
MSQSSKTIASIGSIIEFHNGVRGIVEKIYDNSVLVSILQFEEWDEYYKSDKTVINHKHYQIIQ